jgi:hypothetical protein
MKFPEEWLYYMASVVYMQTRSNVDLSSTNCQKTAQRILEDLQSLGALKEVNHED